MEVGCNCKVINLEATSSAHEHCWSPEQITVWTSLAGQVWENSNAIRMNPARLSAVITKRKVANRMRTSISQSENVARKVFVFR